MSAAVAKRHRRGGHDEDHEEHEEGERWLVSYADMMTLLFALFMVLFSISSVNVSKLQILQKVLQDAFSGKILTGGKAAMESGSTSDSEQPAPEPPMASLSPLAALNQEQVRQDSQLQAQAAAGEQEDFQRLKRRIDALAAREGLAGKVSTDIRRRGLVVELLTDNLFFDSGKATLKTPALKLLQPLSKVISGERQHPVIVEGHTDSQPISGSIYPSNWELSGARAAAVVRVLANGGVLQRRLSLSGYGSQEPADTNSTAVGRAHNRRVDIVLSRIH